MISDHQFNFQSTNNDACFLCGETLSQDASREHVFPKWLQRKYDLWNMRLDLLNKTKIRYSSLLVPCCKKCNNEYLSELESEICKAIYGGYDACVLIPDIQWYLWAGKIFYGILRKEIALSLDQRCPDKGSILPPEVVASYKSLHLFLQGIRHNHVFVDDVPFSVLLCNLHGVGAEFDFRDQIYGYTAAFKMGDVGLIVSFEDGGLSENPFAGYLGEVNSRSLHPVQFYELFARISYHNNRRLTPCKFVSHQTGSEGVINTSMISNYSEFREFDGEELASRINFHLEGWFEPGDVISYAPPDRVGTLLTKQDGRPYLLPLEEW